MTAEREQEIIAALRAIAANFQPTEHEPELTMFGLVRRYNEEYPNPERIGGAWVREHVPEFANLPV